MNTIHSCIEYIFTVLAYIYTNNCTQAESCTQIVIIFLLLH